MTPTGKVYKRDYVLMKETNGDVIEVPIDEGMISVTRAMLRGCVQAAPPDKPLSGS